MLKSPNKTKYESPHLRLCKKGLKGFKRTKKTTIIKSKETHLVTPKHLEATRRILVRPLREDYGDVNFRFFPDLSISKKPLQTRMGKGKGKHHEWVAPIKSGRILLEII
jgi:large subunit ribosomal protein L16